jgi:hypothetical protein
MAGSAGSLGLGSGAALPSHAPELLFMPKRVYVSTLYAADCAKQRRPPVSAARKACMSYMWHIIASSVLASALSHTVRLGVVKHVPCKPRGNRRHLLVCHRQHSEMGACILTGAMPNVVIVHIE